MIGRRSVLLVGPVLFVAACGGINPTEQVLESQEGIQDVEIDEDSGSFSVTDDEGNTVSVSGDDDQVTITDEDGEAVGVFGGGEVPADFPIPFPPDGSVQSVIETPEGAIVMLHYDADEFSFDELVAYYEDFSSGDGVVTLNKLESEVPAQSVMWLLEFNGAEHNVVVHGAMDGVILVQLAADLTG